MTISINTVKISFAFIGEINSNAWQYLPGDKLSTDTNLISVDKRAISFDWIETARTLRALSQPSPDSTPLLRAIREERAER